MEAWSLFLSQKNFGKQGKYGLNISAMPRYSFESENFYQNLLGLSGLYRVNKKITVALGYLNDMNDKFSIKEKRSFIDLLYSMGSSSGKLLIRSRLEYRIFNGVKRDGLRGRLMGRYDFKESVLFDNFKPFFSEEVLIDLKKQHWGNQMGFVQNRLYLGMRTSATKSTKLDLAALVILNQRSTTVDRIIMAPFIGLLHFW